MATVVWRIPDGPDGETRETNNYAEVVAFYEALKTKATVPVGQDRKSSPVAAAAERHRRSRSDVVAPIGAV